MPLRAGLVFWLFLLSAIAFLDRTNISIAGPQISHEYGVGNVWLGWIISPFLIGYGHPKCWLGGLLYGSGREASLPWECCGGAHSRFRPAVRFALGVGEAIIYPASNQFVARWIPVSERGTVNGVIFSGVGAGAWLTPPLLAAIIAAHGWHAAF